MFKKSDLISALASGGLLVLGFPLFDLYPIAWTALLPLLLAVRGKNTRTAFYLGLLTGLTYFAGTIYWVYHSMYVYGGVPLFLSILILMCLSLYLALYTGVFSMLFNYLSGQPSLPALFTVPVLWVSLEYARTYALTGFPWSALGYSQYKFLPFIQIADITGVYGVSFLVAAINGAVYDIILLLTLRSDSGPSRRLIFVSLIVFAFIIAGSLFYGVGKLNVPNKQGNVRVSVTQGNIRQDVKWDFRFQREVIDTYKRLSIEALDDKPDIIIWPESAIPFVFGYDKVLTEEIVNFSEQLNSYLLFGGVVVKSAGTNNPGLSNSAILLSPEGKVLSIYDKIHLVPYGEYVPLKELFPFIDKMVTAIGDFARGKEPLVMSTPFAKIGNLICYEIIFPGLVRKFVDNGADLLVTVTNDAWFGRTAAPYQHFSMAVFRAVENRVPVARAANTGISGFIDSRGRIINRTDIFIEGHLTEKLAVGGDKSFYTEYGDIFAWICIAFSVLLVCNKILTGRKKRTGTSAA
ncbi:MAG: apolipoprotein N-acyltransferase [Nitrospirota bacterium]